MVDLSLFLRMEKATPATQRCMVNGNRRLSVLPQVPTAAEVGLPETNSMGWNGLLAPRGTPQHIIERLQREFVSVLRSPEMEKTVAESGSLIVASTPEEFAAFLLAEQKRMQELVKRTGAKLD